MKTRMTESEVNRVPIDAVNVALPKLPYNSQDPQDEAAARHFLLKRIAKQVNPPLDKIEDAMKKDYREGKRPRVSLTENYRIECSEGTPRENFDLEGFLDKVVEKYPDVMKHVLRELATASKKLTTAPVSISVEYIGDVARQK